MAKTGLQVIKRDGKSEDYDPAKITKVVVAAGLNPEKSKTLVNTINKWVKTLKRRTVSSIEIKDKVSNELKKVDEYAYRKYSWWEKYKDEHFSK